MILSLIEKEGKVSAARLVDDLGISRQAIFKHHLTPMVGDGTLTKVGKPPCVFYVLNNDVAPTFYDFDIAIKNILDENFLYILPNGKRQDGAKGFVSWCEKRNFDVLAKASEYTKIFKKYNALKKMDLISGKKKIQSTFHKNSCLDDLFYADFYAWEIFGKTKLGQILLYAKQSQDRKMIKEVVGQIRTPLKDLIKKKKIDAVGFAPPTVKRSVQFMKVLEKELTLDLPRIEIIKIQTDVVTPQKTLSKLEDRIENANYTMHVSQNKSYRKILLIDDAVGSGATLNQIACKIKKIDMTQRVYGFAITGSLKGFDVISEV